MRITLNYPDEYGKVNALFICQSMTAEAGSPCNVSGNPENWLNNATISFPEDGDEYVLTVKPKKDKLPERHGEHIVTFNDISFEKKVTADAGPR